MLVSQTLVVTGTSRCCFLNHKLERGDVKSKKVLLLEIFFLLLFLIWTDCDGVNLYVGKNSDFITPASILHGSFSKSQLASFKLVFQPVLHQAIQLVGKNQELREYWFVSMHLKGFPFVPLCPLFTQASKFAL